MDLTRGSRTAYFSSPFILFSTVMLLSQLVVSKRIYLLDTTQLPHLKWPTFSSSGSTTQGWSEESYTNNVEGNNRRAYTICDYWSDDDNWLISPYIPRDNANRLYIEVTFTTRECNDLGPPVDNCKEIFSLLYWETDTEFKEPFHSFGYESPFQLLDRLTAISGRANVENNPVHRSTIVRSLRVAKAGIYFAFLDKGSCTSLLSIKVYYEMCEETLINFAWFDQTPAGPELTSIMGTIGHCVENAQVASESTPPKYICKVDGTWDLLSGGCQCNAGFEAADGYCKPCHPNYYKNALGPGSCEKCPKHSESRENGSALCQCDGGYYRAPHDSYAAPCTRPPSKPENGRVETVDQNSATIAWGRPSNLGGRSELWYRVVCRDCPQNAIYSPAHDRLQTTSVTISGLEPGTLYPVFIYAENDVSSQVKGLPMHIVVEVTTSPLAPVVVENLRIESIAGNEVTLSWDPPRTVMNDYSASNVQQSLNSMNPNVIPSRHRLSVHYYILKYFARGRPSVGHSTIQTRGPSASVQDLQPDTEYGFQVRADTSRGLSEWSETRWLKTGSPVDSSSMVSSDSSTIIYLSVTIAILILIACILLVVAYRRRFPFNLCVYKKQPSDLDVLDYKSGNLATEYNTIDTYGGRCEMMACSSSGPRIFSCPYAISTAVHLKPKNSSPFKPYVDPFAYEDPKQALKDFTNEISAENIVVDEIVGEGEFGEVCKGQLRVSPLHTEFVAIKTLKPGSSLKARLDFLTEASIMGQFDHPNVIQLKGVVTRTEPVMILTEFLENGSLDRFLKTKKNRLNVIQLVGMLRDVASGMQYLSDKGFIHRDLAARNVLVDAKICCKIADFGLSRIPTNFEEKVYTTRGGKIPVRWTAPEAIAYRKFTCASDIWSFGVLMWEVMSFGDRPYWDWTNPEVIQKIEEGYRLPIPENCPPALYRLMMNCWNREPSCRPTFHALLSTLANFLLCPEAMYAASFANTISTMHNF